MAKKVKPRKLSPSDFEYRGIAIKKHLPISCSDDVYYKAYNEDTCEEYFRAATLREITKLIDENYESN